MRIAIGWSGLPAYAARLIQGVVSDCPVIATRPKVPIQGMEAILKNRIKWIADDANVGWNNLSLDIPNVFFQPSWSTPAFNRLGDEVRSAGGRVIVMFDNRWRGDVRQFAGAIRFRTQWRDKYFGAWVAGKSGYRLARYWGFSPERIYTGMYGADPATFGATKVIPLLKRPKRFIFVGRLVEQKGVVELVRAWRFFANEHPEWELHVYGVGPLSAEVAGVSGLRFHEFKQPAEIAAAMREARFLVLPSHEEHWGLVVCEAAQCGCGLLLSDKVGSHADLLTIANGRLFKAENIGSLQRALIWASLRSDLELDQIMATSVEMGARFTPSVWAKTFDKILKDITLEREHRP